MFPRGIWTRPKGHNCSFDYTRQIQITVGSLQNYMALTSHEWLSGDLLPQLFKLFGKWVILGFKNNFQKHYCLKKPIAFYFTRQHFQWLSTPTPSVDKIKAKTDGSATGLYNLYAKCWLLIYEMVLETQKTHTHTFYMQPNVLL